MQRCENKREKKEGKYVIGEKNWYSSNEEICSYSSNKEKCSYFPNKDKVSIVINYPISIVINNLSSEMTEAINSYQNHSTGILFLKKPRGWASGSGIPQGGGAQVPSLYLRHIV